MRASRHDSVRRRDQHIDQARFVQLAAPLEHAQANAFSRQSTVDEDSLAVDARDPSAIVGQVHDVGFLHVSRLQVSGHAAANSLRCSAADSLKVLRTRATS